MHVTKSAGIISLALLATLPLTAQEEPNPAFDILSREATEWYTPKTQISFGFRILSSGATVKFGNLGNMASIQTVVPLSEGAVTRIYDNGAIGTDVARLDEIDADGKQISTPGSRYQQRIYNNDGTKVFNPDGTLTDLGDGTFTVVADYLAYSPGYSRIWRYNHPSQVEPSGAIALSSYSTTSEGATAVNEQGATAGVEFQLARQIGDISKKVQWGLVGGIALNDINNKANGTVISTLNARTDIYTLRDGLRTAPYAGPSFTDLVGTNGLTYEESFESTSPISALPISSRNTSVAGGAAVQGNWQVKGAYFMMRLGPSVRAQVTERFGVSASVGVAGAFAGSRYSVVESIELPDVVDPITSVEENTQSKFLGGFYADVNLDVLLNERTGLFGGVSMQQFGDYDQSVGGRTAKVDLGSAIGLRGGINIKF